MPKIPPIIALNPLAVIRRVLEGVIKNAIINRGASFCQVASRMQVGQGRFDITEGNQKCIGAAPSFVKVPRVKIIRELGKDGADSGE